MKHRRGLAPAGGFTLIEVLVTLAVLAIVLSLGIPALLGLIVRSQLEGHAREIAVLSQRARLEAVKRRVQTVVEVDPVTGRAFAFADVDGPAVGDPPDLLFNPVAGELRFTTDYAIGRIEPRSDVEVAGPGAEAPIDGFTAAPGGPVAVFLPTGAADRAGGFRLADSAGRNHLEVRVAPAGTGRVAVRKWDQELAAWLVQQEGGRPWTWY